MATSGSQIANPRFCLNSSSFNPRLIKKKMGTPDFMFINQIPYARTRFKRFLAIGAQDPQRGNTEEEKEKSTPFISQEDLEYLSKLAGGSVVGAAVIKYGSIAFPEITRPNIVLALTIISTPVIVALLLLIKQSRVERGE